MIVNLIQGDDGDLLVPLPQELLDAVGWQIGDILKWSINEVDHSVVITKVENE